MASLTIDKLEQVMDKLDCIPDDYTVFIETGTCGGETVLNMYPYFEEIHTVELSKEFYEAFKAQRDKQELNSISVYNGDSSVVLPKILSENINDDDNYIAWLDGHWSSGNTARGDKDCPLLEECEAIDKFSKSKNVVIVIDDYRLFGTNQNEDWTDITEENILSKFNRYSVVCNVVVDDFYTIALKLNK